MQRLRPCDRIGMDREGGGADRKNYFTDRVGTQPSRVPSCLSVEPFFIMTGFIRRIVVKLRDKGFRYCLQASVRRGLSSIRTSKTAFGRHACALLLSMFNARVLVGGLVPRIGHLACEPDCFVKEGVVGMRPPFRGVLIVPRGKCANRCLLDYWRKYLTVVTSEPLCRTLASAAAENQLTYDVSQYVTAINSSARYVAVQAAYDGRPALLQLSEEHRLRGRERLSQLGMPRDAWFVCVHCREAGYASKEPCHDFRNVKVTNYFPAMKEVVSRGGWCVRIGDPTMEPLPPMDNVVDYAHHPLRCDWMDVFLCAACEFFLGSSSGPPNVASAFGVPCATANHAPLSVVLSAAPHDIGIPKLFWSRSQKRLLKFEELFDSPLGNARFANLYEDAGITLIENSAEEIRDLALEMIERLEGRLAYSDEDERLQNQFRSLLRPGHYSFGSKARIGRDFLRKYRWLLVSQEPLASKQVVRGHE